MKKRFLYFLILVLIWTGFSPLRAQVPADTTKARIGRILDQWHRNAARADHDAYIGQMDANGVYIGTDASEYWTTAEFSAWSKPYFDQKKSWDFLAVNRNIYLSDDRKTAWFDELLSTKMGLCRGSGVLKLEKGKWKIAQYVLSPTIPNEIMKRVTGMKAAYDSAYLLNSIFDQYAMTGTMILYDREKNRYLGCHSEKWDSGYLPASTFKIANTLTGLENGVIDTGYIFKWNGEKRRLPQWEKDLTLREAFRVSCVPCYQELARKTGPDRMKATLERMGYPGMDVRPENIDLFWLEGDSRITPRQQVDFVRRLYEDSLGLKPEVIKAVKSIMVNEVTPEYTLCGKTGWAVRNGNNYGWFVGWIKTGNKVWFLATLVDV